MIREINPANPKELKGLTLRFTKKLIAKIVYIIAALTVELLAPVRIV